MNRTSYDLARRLYATALLHLTTPMTLRSGEVSNTYFDKYLFEADPVLLRDVATAMLNFIPPEVEIVAGLELGAISVTTMISHYSNRPMVQVRKRRKDYGTMNLIEGGKVEGKNVMVIEDVVTSGGAVVVGVEALRREGARVTHALCVVDREAGGVRRLAVADVRLRPLLTLYEVLKAGMPWEDPGNG